MLAGRQSALLAAKESVSLPRPVFVTRPPTPRCARAKESPPLADPLGLLRRGFNIRLRRVVLVSTSLWPDCDPGRDPTSGLPDESARDKETPQLRSSSTAQCHSEE